MAYHSTRSIDWRSLCYGVDKHMDAPEPAYLFPGHVFYEPVNRNRTSGNHGYKENNKKESR
jgi:hypothetical protein